MATTTMLAVVRDGKEILSAHHLGPVAWLEAAKLDGKTPEEIQSDRRYTLVNVTVSTK
jgi:hypothetical protein